MATYTRLEVANSQGATWADLDATYVSASSTSVVLANADGTLTGLNGSGFTFTGSGGSIVLTGGTISQLGRTNLAGTTLYEQVTGVSYAATVFQGHMSESSLNGVMSDLFNGSDTLFGFSGSDKLRGFAGTDVLIGGPGSDVLDGGGGTNIASYENASAGVIANLSDPSQNTGDAAGDTYISIQWLFGTQFSDTLIGNGAANMLRGGPGADRLDGGIVPEGQGGDFADYRGSSSGLTASLADPTQNTGEAAGDTYANIGSIRGSFFNDTLVGDDNGTTLRGGAGADVLDGRGGSDFASYADSPVGITASLADPSQNTGEAAGDTYISIENLAGSSFNDTLIGDAGDNILQGHQGADRLDGGPGNDRASYSSATSGLIASLADPASNTGEAAGDSYISIEGLRGGNFQDLLVGDARDNILAGAGGDDTLRGGAGNDVLNGGSGDDVIDGGAGNDTTVFSGNFNDSTVENFGSNIVVVGPDGTDSLTSIEHLKFADVTITPVDDGDPLFDTLYYLSRNPDVFQAGVNALDHYNAFGWHEGRNPNAFFDTSGYLAANPEAKAAGISPLEHYHNTGWREGRDPSANFDTELYLVHNPDVAAAGVDPLEHFLAFGRLEGRSAYDAVGPTVNGFDAQYYLLHNADIAAAGVDPLAHFDSIGWQEGRNPNAWFDAVGYLSHYADVAAAGVNPLEHYNSFGWKEGRDPSTGFDTASYLTAYPDVAAANVNPLLHFLQFGIYEGRSPFADGVWG